MQDTLAQQSRQFGPQSDFQMCFLEAEDPFQHFSLNWEDLASSECLFGFSSEFNQDFFVSPHSLALGVQNFAAIE